MIRGAVAQIFNEKNGKETINRPLQKLHPLEITPERERDDDEQSSNTNDVEIEESKSLNDLDSAKGDLGRSDAGGSTKI